MPKIEVKGLKELQAGLDDLIKHRIPKITAIALTKTAEVVKLQSRQEMTQVFDRPTPFILRSQYVQMATANNLTASVEWKSRAGKGVRQWDAATRTLSPHVEGGGRELKGFEFRLRQMGILPPDMYAMPGVGAEIDAYGNMSRGQIIQILSYFQTFPEMGYRANMTAKKIERLAKGSKRKGQRGFVYFVKRNSGGVPLGIYRRTSFGAWGSAIKPILIFTPRQPGYRRRWDVFANAQKVVDKEFPKIFKQVADETLAYWQKK
ncbi:hypothetical protein HY948_03520 [Candidatus Gottesmanbacteria bacterium]|nr:hypothetical protein [Candidatus Gottesmanbacteria bacterium]